MTLGERLNSRARILLAVGLAVLLVLSGRRLLGSPDRPVVEFNGMTMGTTYNVKIAVDTLPEIHRNDLGMAIEQHLVELNQLMSTYDPGSEIEQFNHTETGSPFQASESVIEVFAMARDVSERTGGAFDVTVRPLVETWGFGSSSPPSEPPPDSIIDMLRERVGYRNVVIDSRTGTLTKTHPGLTTDLSAIAKGYAVDVIADFLTTSGFCCFLVEIGGELKARGVKQDGTPWRIGLETPSSDERGLQRTIELRDAAMATSGDYRNFFEWNNERYAHILDPRTGYPVPYRSAAVTVVHAETAIADAWATALSVLGPEQGHRLAESERIAAHFTWIRNGEIGTRTTTEFRTRYP